MGFSLVWQDISPFHHSQLFLEDATIFIFNANHNDFYIVLAISTRRNHKSAAPSQSQQGCIHIELEQYLQPLESSNHLLHKYTKHTLTHSPYSTVPPPHTSSHTTLHTSPNKLNYCRIYDVKYSANTIAERVRITMHTLRLTHLAPSLQL